MKRSLIGISAPVSITAAASTAGRQKCFFAGQHLGARTTAAIPDGNGMFA